MADARLSRPSGVAVPIAVAVTALAPFLQPVGPIDPYTMRFAGIFAAAVAWFWAWVIQPGEFRGRRRLVLAAAVVGAATVLSAMFSWAPGVEMTWGAEGGLMGAPTWLALLAVFVFATSVRPSAKLTSALRLLFLWGAVSTAMVLWERASSAPQVTGGFGNGNYAGAALVALVPLALFYAGSEPDPRYRPWWRYLVLALVAGVLAAGSLSNIIALAVVAAGTCILAPGPLLGIDRRTARRIAAAIVVVVLVAGAVIGLASTTRVLPKAVGDFVAGRVGGGTVVTRLEMWKMSLKMFADHPVLGVGPGGMQHMSQGYLPERLLELEVGGYTDYRVLVKDPHSLPLLVLASLGIVGCAALLWLAFEWLREAMRLVKAGNAESRSWSLRCALLLAVAGHLTALLFMPWAVAFGPMLPLLAGLAIASGWDRSTAKRATNPRLTEPGFYLPLLAAVAATLIAAWLVGAAMYGESQVTKALNQSSPELARDAYATAAKAQPTRPYVVYEELYAEGFLASEGLADLVAYQRSVDSAPAAVTDDAGFLANLVQPSLDEAYLTGRTQLAWERERIERAADLAPNHPDVVLEEAHVALLSGDTRAAGALLNRAERFSPNAARYLLYRYYFDLASGESSAAAALVPRIEAAGPGHSRLAKGWSR